MKYLKNFFNEDFTKILDCDKKIGNGAKFEAFIEKLLICEFPEYKVWKKLNKQKIVSLSKSNLAKRKFCLSQNRYTFPKLLYRTKTTHDGGKDFVLVNGDKNIWVECKNYRANLSLKNISNTLVFAHIKDIKEIIIFSLSKLNPNALDNISQFFKHDGKTVRIYDDEALENLIFFHYDKLKADCKLPDKESLNISEADYASAHIYSVNIFEDNVHHSMNLIPQVIKEFDVNGILGIDILIKNSSSKQNDYSVSIVFDNFYFVDFSENQPQKHLSFNYTLKSCEQKIFSYFFKIKGLEIFKDKLNLPKISVKETGSNKSVGDLTFELLEIKHIDKTKLVGVNRLKKIADIKEKIENDTFKGVLFYGRSGTGKTRMLHEILPYVTFKNIRIIYFNIKEWSGESVTSAKIFKKLLYNLLNIPLNTGKEMLKEYFDNFSDDTEAIIKLLEDPSDIQNFDKFDIFYNLLTQFNPESKICLAIDNIQFLSSDINDFLYKLAVKNKSDNGKLILTWIINDDYSVAGGAQDEEKIKLIFDNRHYMFYEISDLADDEIKLFIREVLKCNFISDITEINNFLKGHIGNPYILETVLEWLNSNGYIFSKENKFIVKDSVSDNFSSMVVSADSKVKSDNPLEPLKNLWDFYIKMNPEIENEALLIIAAIHFLGKLRINDLESFYLSDEIANKLLKLRFLKIDNENEVYLFEHDMVEFCFTNLISTAETLSEIFINHLDSFCIKIISDYSPFCERYKFIYDLLNNSEKNCNFAITDDLINLTGLPCNIEKEYLKLHSELLLCQLKMQADKIKILSCFRSIAGIYRESLGSAFLINLYNKIYVICEDNYDAMLKNEVFGWFTIEYCNILSDSGYLELAEIKMKNIVVSKVYSNKNLAVEFMFLKAYFLNRLAVYIMKQTALPISSKYIKHYYNKSLRIAKRLEEFGDNRSAEIKYINYTDIGYLYYFDKVVAQKALKMFDKAIEVYEGTNLWQKTMNNFHGKIMSEMIQGNCENAIKIAEDGINYCYVGEFHYYDGFFMEHFLILQASAYLMRKSEKDIQNCLDNLERIKNIDKIIDIKFLSLVLQVEGVCDYYKGDNKLALKKFLEAYKCTKDKNNKINLNPRLKQLKFNIIKLCALAYGGELNSEVLEYNEQNGGLDDVCNEISSKKFETGQYASEIPQGIFIDKDSNFNLPFI